MNKISIRFYKDREVRAIWNDSEGKWYFSALDLIGAINEQDDYQKNRNYWKYLKNKLKKEKPEVVSGANQLKMLAPDGKQRLTDVIDQNSVALIASVFPNNKATDFLDWFTYSDNTLTGKVVRKLIYFLKAT